MNNYAIGVDIGGGHISAALVDITDGTLIPGSNSTKKINNKEN